MSQRAVAKKRKIQPRKKTKLSFDKEQKRLEKEQAAYQKGLAIRAHLAHRRALYDRLVAKQRKFKFVVTSSRVNPNFDPPSAGCPKCGKFLSIPEIRAAFADDSLEYHVTCPHCNHKFSAYGTMYTDDYRQPFIMLCPSQTLDQFQEWMDRTGAAEDDPNLIDKVLADAPHLVWNAYFNSTAEGTMNEMVIKFLFDS